MEPGVRRTSRTPLRVLLVGEGPPTRGGIPTFLTQLLRDPVLREHVAFSWLNTTEAEARRPGGWDPTNLRRLLRDARRVFSRAGDADLVHLHVAPAPLAPLLRTLLLAAAGRARGAAVIVHAHSGRIHRSMSSQAYSLAMRTLALVASSIVVVSEREWRALRRIPGVRLITNGVPVPQPEALRKTPWQGPITIVFVGTVCERKGLLDLFAAMSGVTEPSRILVVGDDRQEAVGTVDRIRAAAASVSGPHEVYFAGALCSGEVQREVGAADIFVLPSHWEGQPLSVLEAMALGVPVVATDVGDISHMLAGGRAGIVVPPHDPAALGEALDLLAHDPSLRSHYGEEGQRRVRDAYDAAETSARILALYEAMLYSRYPRPRSDASMVASSSEVKG